MTTGAVIFASNNEKIDYVALAEWSSKNIQRHLGIPTHIIVTDSVSTNQRWSADTGTVTWHNKNRCDALELSPWDQTLLLDADYVVASDQLTTILRSDLDFACHGRAWDITGTNDFGGVNYFGRYAMPMLWATVVMFRRSQRVQALFAAWRMVQQHWSHYEHLLAMGRTNFRNDYALTIAANIENGHTMRTTTIPWDLATVTADHELTQRGLDHYQVTWTTAQKQRRRIELRGQDFHAMGKRDLGDIIASAS